MRPKHKDAAARSGIAASDRTSQSTERSQHTQHRRIDQTALRFSVLVSIWGRRKLWSRYPSREAAVAKAAHE